jgi:hypothetical protein
VFVTPLNLGLGLASYDDVNSFVNGRHGRVGMHPVEIAVILLFSLAFHAPSALFLLGNCLSRFEIEAGRPHRDNPRKRPSRRP